MHLLVNRYIVANTGEFALETNALGVIGSGEERVEWGAALWVCVVVVVLQRLARVIKEI